MAASNLAAAPIRENRSEGETAGKEKGAARGTGRGRRRQWFEAKNLVASSLHPRAAELAGRAMNKFRRGILRRDYITSIDCKYGTCETMRPTCDTRFGF